MLFRTLLRFCPPGQFLNLWPILAEGDVRRGVELFLAHCGLRRSDLTAASAVRRGLRGRLRTSSPETSLRYVRAMGTLVHLYHSPAAALVILEVHAGVVEADYPRGTTIPGVRRTSHALADKLRRLTGPARSPGGYGYVGALANACAHVERRGIGAALAVCESFLSLTADDYSPDALRAKLATLPTDLPSAAWPLLQVLTGLLWGAGCAADARALQMWLFGLRPADFGDARRMAEQVLSRSQLVPAESRPTIAGVLATVLSPVLRRVVLLEFVERLLGVTPDLYRDPPALARRLAGDEVHEAMLGRAVCLLEALNASGKFDGSLAVFRALSPRPADGPLDGVPEVVARTTRLIDGLPRHGRAGLQACLLHMLFGLKELGVAATYAEDVFRLTAREYRVGVPAVARTLREGLPGFSPEEGPQLLTQLTATLADLPGRRADARNLAEAFLWDVIDLPSVPTGNAAAVPLVSGLVEMWLEMALGASASGDAAFRAGAPPPPPPPPVSAERCQAVVAFVRASLAWRGVRLEDRREFSARLSNVRRLLVDAGRLLQAGAGSPAERAEIQLRSLFWDVELSRRILLEEFRFRGGDAASVSDDHGRPDALFDGWSLGGDEPGDIDDDAPPGGDAELGRLRADAPADARRSPEPSGDEPVGPPASPVTGGPGDVVERVIRSGVDPVTVARALGDRARLLRAWFTRGGDLGWLIVGSLGGQLEVLGSGETSCGTARRRLHRAVAWHDTTLEWLWAEARHRPGPLRSLCRQAEPDLREFVRRLCDRRGTVDAGDLARRRAVLMAMCASNPAGAALGDWLEGHGLPAADGGAGEVERCREAHRYFLDTVALFGTAPVAECLDRATDEFLRWVSRVWDLGAVAAVLGPDDDLVVDVDDALHGVPISFVPVGQTGAPLFQCVRTVRTNVSLVLAADAVGEGGGPRVGSDGDVVTVSWFREDDPDRAAIARGEWWLHAGQRTVAGRTPLGTARGLPLRRWRTASVRPRGSVDALTRGLPRGGPVRVLTLCGHGSREACGVKLGGPAGAPGAGERPPAEVLWSGAACDLAGVDLLVLVSCSVGRLRHAAGDVELPDVEGLVVNLAARHARSILACRWPVHCLQAPHFANAVAGEYCTPLRQSGRADRALALARARRKFCCNARPPGYVIGLNTLAAFELYGAG